MPSPDSALVASTGGCQSPLRCDSGPIASIDFKSGHGPVRIGPVGLGDDVDIRDLEDARLDRLDVVAQAGRGHDDRRVRRARDVDLVLADADRLDDDDLVARGIEDVDGIERAAREPAQRAARGHASHEHARVAADFAHPDAVAENRAARER